VKQLSWYFFFIFIFWGCQPKESPVSQTADQKTAHQSLTDTSIKEIAISNTYTKIVDSLCLGLKTNEISYTNLNTDIYILHPEDSTDCFVFASEATCGFLPGSCGRDIQIIKKTKKEGYRVAFSTCGNILTTINEKNDNILSFLYGTQDGYIVKVFWDGREFEDKTISINNISYNYIIKIAEATRHNPTDFILYDPHHPDSEKIPVIIEDFNLGINKYGKRFKVLFEREPEIFIFENKEDHPKIILTAKGSDTLQVITGTGKEYFDVSVNRIEPRAERQIWKYNYQKQQYSRY